MDLLFSHRGLSLDRLSSFLRVIDAGGIAPAAPGNVILQSQLSRQVRELEDFFGGKLFERKNRGLSPTATGHHLAAVVRSIFSGLADVAREIDRAPSPWALGAGDSLLHWWIIPRLPRAIGLESSLELRSLPTEDIAERLLDGRLELGILGDRRARAGLETRSLGVIEDLLFVPRSLLSHPRAPLVEILASVPLALQDTEPEQTAPLFDLARRAKTELRIALRVETMPQAHRALLTGAYAALLPSLATKDVPAKLFRRFSLGKQSRRPLSLAWDPRLVRRRPTAKSVIDRVASILALD